uniref:AN1-type domain-containing protein n=1 Tax=Clastoptera arizonana TaxID=38151 RepID=A0A1B6D899_9HEMI
MEFPELTEKCDFEQCKRLDFLPVPCTYCSKVFCQAHSSIDSHKCSIIQPDIKDIGQGLTKDIQKHSTNYKHTTLTNQCVEENCTLIGKILTHYDAEDRCSVFVEHNHKRQILLKKHDIHVANKTKFLMTKSTIDNQMTQKLNNEVAKNNKFALSLRLMRMKQIACGENSVPVLDRVYFMVYYNSNDSKAVFASKSWTVGRCVDFFANKFHLTNNNNKRNGDKLMLLKKEDDATFPMDEVIGDIINSGKIQNGEELLLKRVNL